MNPVLRFNIDYEPQKIVSCRNLSSEHCERWWLRVVDITILKSPSIEDMKRSSELRLRRYP
jgi:hypothetical protein